MKNILSVIFLSLIVLSCMAQDKSLYNAGRQGDNHVFEKKDSVTGPVIVTYTLADVYDDDRETYVVKDTFELQALIDVDEEDTGITEEGDVYVYKNGSWTLHYDAFNYAANCCEDIYHTSMYVTGDSLYLVSDRGGDTLTAPIYNVDKDSIIKVTSIDVTGNETKIFELIQSNGDTLTTQWLDLSEVDTTGNATADLDSIIDVTFDNSTRILSIENKNFHTDTTLIPDANDTIKVTELYFQSDTSLYLIQSNGDTLIASYINDTTDIVVNNYLHNHGDTSIHLGGKAIEYTLLETERLNLDFEKLSTNGDSLYFSFVENNKDNKNAIIFNGFEDALIDVEFEFGINEDAEFYGDIHDMGDRSLIWKFDEYNAYKRIDNSIRYNQQDFTGDGIVGLVRQINDADKYTQYKFQEANGITLFNQTDLFNQSSLVIDEGNYTINADNDYKVETRDYQNLQTNQWDVLTRTEQNSAVTDFVDLETLLDTIGYVDSIIYVTSIDISGAGTKTITLIQSNGDTLTDQFTDLQGSGSGGSDLDSIKLMTFDVNRDLTITNIADNSLVVNIPDSFWNVVVNNGLHFHGDTSIHLGGDLIEDTEIRTHGYIMDFRKINQNNDSMYFGLVESNLRASTQAIRFLVEDNGSDKTQTEVGVQESGEWYNQVENTYGNTFDFKQNAYEELTVIEDSNESARFQKTRAKFDVQLNQKPATNIKTNIIATVTGGIDLYQSSNDILTQVTKINMDDGDLLISSNDKLLIETKEYLDGNTSRWDVLARINDANAQVEYVPLETLFDSIPIIDSISQVTSVNVTGDTIKTFELIQSNGDTLYTTWTDLTEVDTTGGPDLNDFSTSHSVTIPTQNTRRLETNVTNQTNPVVTFNIEDEDSDPTNEHQNLSVNSTLIDDEISISNGNTIAIDDDLGEVTNVSVTGDSTKTITITNSTGTTVNDNWTDLQGTDDQNITGSQFIGTTLTIGIENGNSQNVNLSSLRDYYQVTDLRALDDGRIRLQETDVNSTVYNTYITNLEDLLTFDNKTDAQANGTLLNGGFWRASDSNKMGVAPSSIFIKQSTAEVDAGAGNCHSTSDPAGFVPTDNECRVWVNTVTGVYWCYNDNKNLWEDCSTDENTNWAKDNLNFTGNRTHDVLGYDLLVDNIDEITFRSDEGTPVDYFYANNSLTKLEQGSNDIEMTASDINLTGGSNNIGIKINTVSPSEKIQIITKDEAASNASLGSVLQLINRNTVDQIEYTPYSFRQDNPPSGDYYQVWNNGVVAWEVKPTVSVEKYLSGFNISGNTPGNTTRVLTGVVENSTNPTVNIDVRDEDADSDNEIQEFVVTDGISPLEVDIALNPDVPNTSNIKFSGYDGISFDYAGLDNIIDVSILGDSITSWSNTTTGADNGLYVNGSDVYLGGTLLENTTIQQDGFIYKRINDDGAGNYNSVNQFTTSLEDTIYNASYGAYRLVQPNLYEIASYDRNNTSNKGRVVAGYVSSYLSNKDASDNYSVIEASNGNLVLEADGDYKFTLNHFPTDDNSATKLVGYDVSTGNWKSIDNSSVGVERVKDYCTPSSTLDEARVLNEIVCTTATQICVDIWVQKAGTYNTGQGTIEHNSDNIADKTRSFSFGASKVIPSGGGIIHTECFNVTGTLEKYETIEFELTNSINVLEFGGQSFTNVCYGEVQFESCMGDPDQVFNVSTVGNDVRLGLSPYNSDQNMDFREGTGINLSVVSPGDVMEISFDNPIKDTVYISLVHTAWNDTIPTGKQYSDDFFVVPPSMDGWRIKEQSIGSWGNADGNITVGYAIEQEVGGEYFDSATMTSGTNQVTETQSFGFTLSEGDLIRLKISNTGHNTEGLSMTLMIAEP